MKVIIKSTWNLKENNDVTKDDWKKPLLKVKNIIYFLIDIQYTKQKNINHAVIKCIDVW